MHGLIFATWEHYLADRFGSPFLATYRTTIGETAATAPLVSQVYDDATLLAGVGVACALVGLPAETVLREYGRYFLLNGLTSHLCAYLLTQVHSGRDLLLVMRHAHLQLGNTPESLTPPLFGYEALPGDPSGLVLLYDSPRQLCPVLVGAIEGAAERYGERVFITEQTCMKQGAPACRFAVQFSAAGVPVLHEAPEQHTRREAQRQLADLVLSLLPLRDGVTLIELQRVLQQRRVAPGQWRPSVLLKALRHLQFVGLAASTATQPGDDLTRRRYWRAPLADPQDARQDYAGASSRSPFAPPRSRT